MSIPARVIAIFDMATIGAVIHLTAQSLSTTQLNVTHDSAVARKHLFPIAFAVGRTILTKDVG
jgi:hypothetical protein